MMATGQETAWLLKALLAFKEASEYMALGIYSVPDCLPDSKQELGAIYLEFIQAKGKLNTLLKRWPRPSRADMEAADIVFVDVAKWMDEHTKTQGN